MLSDEELYGTAVRYCHEYECGNPAKLCYWVSNPIGGYFVADRARPAIGDGGFFISRVDGRVIPLGSGDWVVATIELSDDLGAETVTNIQDHYMLQRIVLKKLARPPKGPDRLGLVVG